MNRLFRSFASLLLICALCLTGCSPAELTIKASDSVWPNAPHTSAEATAKLLPIISKEEGLLSHKVIEVHVETEEERLARELLEAQQHDIGFETILDGIYSRSAILIRYRDDYLGGIVASKDADEQILPASTTKLMTSLLLVENCKDLSEEVYIPAEAYYDYYTRGASMSWYGSNTTVTVEDILYGILFPSGCDCCVAAAIHLSGSEAEFAELMNKRALELGMTNTNFLTSTGLTTAGQYSCAADMVKLLQACYENEYLRSVITATSYDATTGKHFDNGLLIELTPGLDEDVHFLGGKTGYGDPVGRNLCSMAQIGDDIYFLVTLGAFGQGLNHHADARRVYNAIAQGLRDGTIFVPAEEPVE